MLINCQHGYFKFREAKQGEISEFVRQVGLDLVFVDDYFTFPLLEDAPKYSIVGKPYLGVPAIKTFEGEPWEVMRENDLIYDFNKEVVLPILSVTDLISLDQGRNYYITDGLILPGSIMADGSRVTEYSAWLYFDTWRFKYTEIGTNAA